MNADAFANQLDEQTWNDGDFRRYASDPKKVVVIVGLARPGVRPFLCALEYRRFPPRSEANQRFELSLIRWPQPGSGAPLLEYPLDLYALIRIPRLALGGAERIAAEFELRIVPTTPHLAWNDSRIVNVISTQFPERLRQGGFQHVLPFPVPTAPNVRSIENLNAPSPAEYGELRTRDNFLCEQEMEAWAQRMGVPFDADKANRDTTLRSEAVYRALSEEP